MMQSSMSSSSFQSQNSAGSMSGTNSNSESNYENFLSILAVTQIMREAGYVEQTEIKAKLGQFIVYENRSLQTRIEMWCTQDKQVMKFFKKGFGQNMNMQGYNEEACHDYKKMCSYEKVKVMWPKFEDMVIHLLKEFDNKYKGSNNANNMGNQKENNWNYGFNVN